MMGPISELVMSGKEVFGLGWGNWECAVLDMLILGFLLDVLIEMSNECQEGDSSNACYGISEEGWDIGAAA